MEKMDLAQAYIRPADTLPTPQRDGARVIASVATCGGTGNTSSIYNLIQEFEKNSPAEKGLVIDAAFTSGGLSSAFLGIAPDKDSCLNTLLREIDYAILCGDLQSKIGLSQYIRAVNKNIDILASFCPQDINQGIFAPAIDALPFVIGELRQHYDFILLDIPASGSISTYLPVLAICDYVIVPLPLSRGLQGMEMVWKIDRTVLQLILDGHPIEIGGLIPMFYAVDDRDDPRKLDVLQNLFGKLIWPVIPYSYFSVKAVKKAIKGKIAVGYPEVFNNFLKLIRKDRPSIRRGRTIERGRLIIDCINSLKGYHSYEQIATMLRLSLYPDLNGEQVREYLRKLTIFGTKPLMYCTKEYARPGANG